jgi:hypothetical protein
MPDFFLLSLNIFNLSFLNLLYTLIGLYFSIALPKYILHVKVLLSK